ncbi:Scr1 family TA system antitoxin-like transcriptional regulator [Streptomyces sp. DW26H14]|uniref:Scr1 family TA system antitoxin-like transcriptional regulator n=1 Tax=Streptomyces sp. DW26H14 TaxID=3435395 RepID=UPI00403D8228
MYAKKRRRLRNGSAAKMVGAQLAALRRASGFTQESLAERAAIGTDTVASIEQGRRVLKPDQAALLDDLLHARGGLVAAVDNMPEVDRIPAWAEEYVDLERQALAISSYQNQVLPGLLQTEEYAWATFRSRVPALNGDQIAAQTTARLARQEILHRKDPPSLCFIIWEATVRVRLGGVSVFRDQIRHLLACADLPALSLQIMPLEAITHPALDGPFVLLETADHQHLAYTETQRGSQIIDEPDEVSILTQRCAMLRTQALNTEDSKSLLERLGEQCVRH